jgi:hypothetical protein
LPCQNRQTVISYNKLTPLPATWPSGGSGITNAWICRDSTFCEAKRPMPETASVFMERGGAATMTETQRTPFRETRAQPPAAVRRIPPRRGKTLNAELLRAQYEPQAKGMAATATFPDPRFSPKPAKRLGFSLSKKISAGPFLDTDLRASRFRRTMCSPSGGRKRRGARRW